MRWSSSLRESPIFAATSSSLGARPMFGFELLVDAFEFAGSLTNGARHPVERA